MDPSEPSKPTDTGNDAVSRLHQAISEGDEPLVRDLLRQNDDIADARGTDGRTALAVAVEDAQLGLVPVLLDHGADIEAPDASGRTLLHQAVARNNAPLATLLLERGADVEAATPDGEKPLWTAASQGYELVAKLLLQCKADVEAFNAKAGTTALYEAVKQGHSGLVKLLLDNGADIDARRTGPQAVREDGAPLKATLPAGAPSSLPLIIEEKRHHRHPTKKKKKSYMPDYLAGGRPYPKENRTEGASLDLEAGGPLAVGVPPPPRPPIPGDTGAPLVIHPHVKAGKSKMSRPEPVPIQQARPVPVDLVPAHPPHGHPPQRLPGIAGRRLGTVAQRPEKIRPPEADREIPLHRAIMNGDAELVKLLLQHGADVGIRGKDGRSAQQVADEQKEKAFAALLRSGLLLEGPEIKKEGGGKLPETPRLVVPRALPPPRHNPAKMAACRAFEATVMEFYTNGREQRYQQSAPVYDLLYGKGPQAILDAERPESVAGKTPKFTWYHLPANNMEWVEALMTRLSKPQNADTTAEERFWEKLGIVRRKGQHGTRMAPGRASFIRPHSKEIKDERSSENHVGDVSTATNSSMTAFDLADVMHIPYLHFESYPSHELLGRFMDEPQFVAYPTPSPFVHSPPPPPGGYPPPPPPGGWPPPPPPPGRSEPSGTDAAPTHPSSPTVPNPRESTERAATQPGPAGSRTHHDRVKAPYGPTLGATQHQGMDHTHPYLHLIAGYFQPERPGDVTGWQPRRSLDGYFYSHLGSTKRRDGDQVVLRYTRNNRLPPMIFMVDQLWVWSLGNEAIITCSPLNWDSWVKDTRRRGSRGRNVGRNVHTVAREDPMNLHQKVLRHLKSPDRQAITSVHDLACLITDTCAGLFDQDEILDEFQFFDFFERDIVRLSDTAMVRLEDFKGSLERPDLPRRPDTMHIKTELALLVEVQDICDELEILAKVLKDQDGSMTQMRNILAARGKTKWTSNRVAQLHAQCVDRLQQMATKTKNSLYHLLNLKLKQASFSEAIDTRKQAENTTKQTTLAADNSKVMTDQLRLMQDHFDETGRQGMTLLVFTVVTIIFLPSSFMAAVFSVDLDAFPVGDNDKLPLDYFLKYLFATSCAITIPLVLIAFNIPRLAAWWTRAKDSAIKLWREDRNLVLTGAVGPAIALVIEAAVVGAIWAAPLAAGIKAAVTACISLVVGVVVLVLGVYAMGFWAERLARPAAAVDEEDSGSEEGSDGWMNWRSGR